MARRLGSAAKCRISLFWPMIRFRVWNNANNLSRGDEPHEGHPESNAAGIPAWMNAPRYPHSGHSLRCALNVALTDLRRNLALPLSRFQIDIHFARVVTGPPRQKHRVAGPGLEGS